jgi:DNA primase
MKSTAGNGLGTKTPPIEVSHPDKVFWPEEGYAKLDLIK